MSGIEYVRGDATAPQGKGVKLIAHVCNDLGGWGKGFVLAISRRWPEPEAAYRRWHRERSGNDFGLGAVQYVQVEPICGWRTWWGSGGYGPAARACRCGTRRSTGPRGAGREGRRAGGVGPYAEDRVRARGRKLVRVEPLIASG